jgi:hypothetical protein
MQKKLLVAKKIASSKNKIASSNFTGVTGAIQKSFAVFLLVLRTPYGVHHKTTKRDANVTTEIPLQRVKTTINGSYCQNPR